MKKVMKDDEKQMHEWIESYYVKIYKFVCNSCKNHETAERVANSTLESAYKYMRKLRHMDNMRQCSWMMRTARYYVVKEIYESWEHGEDINARYRLEGEIDSEQCQKLLKQYEANPFLDE